MLAAWTILVMRRRAKLIFTNPDPSKWGRKTPPLGRNFSLSRDGNFSSYLPLLIQNIKAQPNSEGSHLNRKQVEKCALDYGEARLRPE